MAFTQTATDIWYSATQDDADTKMRYVSWIKWIGATTAGHKCVVTDTAGNKIFDSEANGANFIDFQMVDSTVTGIKVADLDSGHLILKVGPEITF